MITLFIENYTHITTNSKKVKDNSIFVSINTNKNYIEEAIKNGASLIVSTKKLNVKIKNIAVKNIMYFFSYWYQKINKINMNDFKIVGVTGTDGKTTTCKMIYDTITERFSAMYIGTLGIFYLDKKIKTNNTTPDIEVILESFITAKENNIKYIIIEASSEGLMNKRLIGIKFDIVVFTNLSHEHLNSHKTMENYFKTKKTLLKLTKENAVVISNIEDHYGKKFQGVNNINFGLHKGKVRTIYFFFRKQVTYIVIVNNDEIYNYKIPFVGVYNIYNFLATHAVISCLFNVKIFKFDNLKNPDGRFMIIDKNIIVDFAHTPNALENLLITIQDNFVDKKIILVLGSQGEKDKSKRIKLGRVADKYCQHIILTSEDPKNESVINIIFDISLGIINTNYSVELYRKNAISKALKLRNSNNIIVVVGKGLEETEQIGNKTYKHSDFEEIKNQVFIT